MPQETMTSRQRVVATLRRQPADRMPIDLGSHPSTGISVFAYHNLRKHLGLDVDRIWIPDVVQMLAYVDEDIRRRFHIDCIMLEPEWPVTHVWNPRGEYRFHIPTTLHPRQDASGDWIVEKGGESMRMPAGGYFFDGAWLCDWGDTSEDESIELYGRLAERVWHETDYATNFVGYSRGLGFGAFFGGLDRAILMTESPEQAIAENEATWKLYERRLGKILDRMGRYVQLITMGDDLGMQSGPLCRPAVLEQCVMPFVRRFCDFVHRHSDVKVFLHCCGSIRSILPMLIDAGIDVINPVQISAHDMDPATLKREFGEKIIFWGGGCDTQNILTTGTPDDVRRNVTHLASIFNQGGGFVFNPVHNILGDVPPQNIVALFDTAYAVSG